MNDLLYLAKVSDFDEVAADASDNPLFLFLDEYVRDVFLRVDMKVMWSAYASVAVPESIQTMSADPIFDECSKDFVCGLDLGDGVMCTAAFSTNRACVCHRVHSKLPGHGIRILARTITISNQCLLCGAILRTRHAAQHHLAKSFERKYCYNPRGSCVVHDVVGSPPYRCELCDEEFSDLISANWHLASHIPPDLQVVLIDGG